MSQEYAYVCQRAELLDLPVPTEEEWAESQKIVDSNVKEQDTLDNTLTNLDQSEENVKRVGGGLDELNTILSATQKKINRFKTVCGSLTTLLKGRTGSRTGTPNHKPLKPTLQTDSDKDTDITDEKLSVESPENATIAENSKNCNTAQGSGVSVTKIDINEKMGSNLDKLESLIFKAETAQNSMQHQTKQMKRFLK